MDDITSEAIPTSLMLANILGLPIAELQPQDGGTQVPEAPPKVITGELTQPRDLGEDGLLHGFQANSLSIQDCV